MKSKKPIVVSVRLSLNDVKFLEEFSLNNNESYGTNVRNIIRALYNVHYSGFPTTFPNGIGIIKAHEISENEYTHQESPYA